MACLELQFKTLHSVHQGKEAMTIGTEMTGHSLVLSLWSPLYSWIHAYGKSPPTFKVGYPN